VSLAHQQLSSASLLNKASHRAGSLSAYQFYSSSTSFTPVIPLPIKMKFSSAVSLFAGLAAALPAMELAPGDALEARQLGNTRNDLQNGGTCPPVIFIFARGSTESGNLVRLHAMIPSSPRLTRIGNPRRPCRLRPREWARPWQRLGSGCWWSLHGKPWGQCPP